MELPEKPEVKEKQRVNLDVDSIYRLINEWENTKVLEQLLPLVKNEVSRSRRRPWYHKFWIRKKDSCHEVNVLYVPAFQKTNYKCYSFMNFNWMKYRCFSTRNQIAIFLDSYFEIRVFDWVHKWRQMIMPRNGGEKRWRTYITFSLLFLEKDITIW